MAESPYDKSAMVRVNITTPADDSLLLKGRLLDEYHPTLVYELSSTGVVLDTRDHIMAFLGYGRGFVKKQDAQFEIAASEGRRFKGKLLGIDHDNGAAVIHVPGVKLRETSICVDCDLREGSVVIAPVHRGTGGTHFQATRIIYANSRAIFHEKAEMVLRTNHPYLDVGQPVFSDDNRVLGFIASQEDPSGVRNVMYPISELLSSAKKIIEKRGDIRNGWLGVVYPKDIKTPVKIGSLVKDGPAQKAGLAAEDIVVGFNGHRIRSYRELTHLVRSTPVGTRAEMEIERNGRSILLKPLIQALEYQNPSRQMTLYLQDYLKSRRLQINPRRETAIQGPRIGFDKDPLTNNPADHLKMPRRGGILVMNVVKQSPADQAGIKNGDVILFINEQPVTDAQEVTSYLQSLNPGSIVKMKVLRENSELTVDVRLPE